MHLPFRRTAAAALAIGLLTVPAPASAQSDEPGATVPPTLPSSDDLTPGLPVPDDTGVVHSWALAPGDGTAEAGERPNLSYEIAPGGQVDDLVTLYNFSNVPLTFGLYATDAFNNDDGSFNLLPAAEEPTDVGTWVSLPSDIESLTIPPGQQATFPITIKVPVDATPGDHVGALLASSTAVGTGPDNAVVTLDRRTGTRLYVRVTGQLRSELAVEDLETSYNASANPFGGSAEVSYRIVNRGNVRLAGTHQLTVSGPFGLLGQDVAPADIPELLPGESMEVSAAVDDVSATGLMFAKVEIDPRSPAGGDEELPASSNSASTRAVPYTILALLIVVIFLLLARRAFRRHRTEVAVIGESGDVVIVPVEVIDVTDDRQPSGR